MRCPRRRYITPRQARKPSERSLASSPARPKATCRSAARSFSTTAPFPCASAPRNILWFEFAALCEGPRAVSDYIELAKAGPEIIISNVPQFSVYTDDAARRFVLLVDEFYDRRVKLILSAAAPITELYDGERLRAEFGRTESRLIEMQSEEYLASDHLP